MVVGYEIIKHGVHEMPRNMSWLDGCVVIGWLCVWTASTK